MGTTSVASVYIHVVEDVISKVREEFINYGVGENILSELQGLWEMKMMQCGVITGNIERPSLSKVNGAVTPVHDLNVPYEGPTEEYETPTAEMLFPPTPLQTPIPTPLPGTVDSQMYQAATPNDFAPSDDTRDGEMKVGRPSPYMQPPSPWMNQRPLGVDVNVAYDEGQDESDRRGSHHPRTQDFFMPSSGKRKRDDYASHVPPDGYIPQQDGTTDVTIEFFLSEMAASGKDSNSGIMGGSPGKCGIFASGQLFISLSTSLPLLNHITAGTLACLFIMYLMMNNGLATEDNSSSSTSRRY